jgi:hypothetical protein
MQFDSADEAWFFTLKEIQRGEPKGVALQVFKVVEALFQKQRLTLQDIQCMNKWGSIGSIPDKHFHGERRLWVDAMKLIGAGLRERGIIQ